MRPVADDEDRGLRPVIGGAALHPVASGPEEPSSGASEERDRLARQVDVLETRISLMAQRERRARGRLVELEVGNARAVDRILALEQHAAAAEERAAQADERAAGADERAARAEERAARADERAAHLSAHIEAMHRTSSWRVTAPLRRLRELQRR